MKARVVKGRPVPNFVWGLPLDSLHGGDVFVKDRGDDRLAPDLQRKICLFDTDWAFLIVVQLSFVEECMAQLCGGLSPHLRRTFQIQQSKIPPPPPLVTTFFMQDK
jgi:hypothetical protein